MQYVHTNCRHFSHYQNNIESDENKYIDCLLMKLTRQIIPYVVKLGTFVSAISGSQGAEFYQEG
jgi:hypothetical protein